MNAEHPVKAPKKLIEVALPLDAINTEAARRKRKAPSGYPTTFHKWWAQRPVAAARAVIFGQLVNDPSWRWELETPGRIPPSHLKASWAKSRKRLFSILEELVKWENTNNESVLEAARAEIRKSWRETCDLNSDHPQAAALFDPERLPILYDPFAGAGSIPMEAQRLGLVSLASDLNPVAVLITKATIEIPSRFAPHAPVGPLQGADTGDQLALKRDWVGTTGLAEDLRRYGAWVREEAWKRIGHLYPPVKVTPDMVEERPDLKPLLGKALPVIAWIWARTVKSPNPAFRHVDVPLASTFILSNRAGKESFVAPLIHGDGYRFTVNVGKPPPEAGNGTKIARGANFRCLLSGTPIEGDYIKSEGRAGRMGVRLMAIVAEAERGRIYLAPTVEHEAIARQAQPVWKPETSLPDDPRNFWTVPYGLTRFSDLFTCRQLLSLTTVADIVAEAQKRIRQDALAAGFRDDDRGLESGGSGATAYAEAICVYLTFVMSRVLHYSSTICTWLPKDSAIARTFTKQLIPMSWDFAEGSVFGRCSTGWSQCCEVVARAIENFVALRPGTALMADAAAPPSFSGYAIISTDPPYYDNVAYADLSDFFYLWLRRALKPIFASLFATIAVPKAEELVATPYRHGGKENAEAFFLSGMTRVMAQLAARSHPSLPVTIYYAFKQSETKNEGGTSSTGWETFLEAVIRAGFSVVGTWPMRTEGDNRQVGHGTNVLASSIVLVCRPRLSDAPTTSRRAFQRELNQLLPEALDEMTRGSGEERSPVAPVDLSQAIIGPGMAVFSRYSAVLEADGCIMLGCLQPGQTSSVYSDALNRLADRLHYLNSSGDKAQDTTRFWFDTRANLRREMEDRKRRFDEKTEVKGKIADALKKVVGSASFFEGVHIFTPHGDVPDDSALRMVVLQPETWYAREESRLAFDAALECVRANGTKPRYRGNRLLFLAADHGTLSRLHDAARVALAWGSIVNDVKEGRLNIDLLQKKQAEKEQQTADEVLPRAARECYKWLLCPVQETPADPKPSVEAFPLNTSGGSVSSELERVCVENELVIKAWSPVHLRSKLQEFYWKDGRTAAGAVAFWEDTLRYLYLPRLKSRDVLAQAIRTGATSRDFFGTAYGQSGDTFEGFALGKGDVQLDDTLLLIEPDAARVYEDAHRLAPTPPGPGGSGTTQPVPTLPTPPIPIPPTSQAPRSFHGTAEVAAATAKVGLVRLADEIIAVLCSDPNASVKVVVEISAEFPDGSKEQVKRAVSENARALGLKSADWE